MLKLKIDLKRISNKYILYFNMANVNKTYQKLSLKDHIQKLPDTYIGDIDLQNELLYTLSKSDDNIKIVKKEIVYVPGLYKIYDEIIVNSLDHISRLLYIKKKNEVENYVSKIRITIEDNKICVFNDGDGIDLVKMYDGKYPPQLIFGELLSSTNYNEKEIKTIGGKNGYGAKLTNIFSDEFIVETVDSKTKLKFKQKYQNNMSKINKPVISECDKEPYTKIIFKPDLTKFKLEKLTDDILDLFEKRVYDMCAWTDSNISIYFNKKPIKYKSFEKYVELYLEDKPKVYEKLNDRWEICVSTSNDNVFQHVSFVNGINTIKGGKHIDYISDLICDKLIEYFNKKKIRIRKNIIKNQLFVFVKCVINNPSFDSQTKETLTTKKQSFGSSCEISNQFINKLLKIGLEKNILDIHEFDKKKEASKTDGKMKKTIYGIPKLSDANKAGTKESIKCTLILTEGDSAKTMAISGIPNRNYYGVFPLRGKLLNVKDSSFDKIVNNEEITNIKKILGLKNNELYDNLDNWPLRYGKIMIMTDQDVDGSHIKGLIMNLFHSKYPNLIKNTFITCLLTPIIKATKNKNIKSFYTLQDYEKWEKSNNVNGFKIKYYKGLGTSNTKEAKEYFNNMKLVTYNYSENCDNKIDLAFNKKRANDRKTWLNSYDNKILDMDKKEILYSDFIDKELIQFSRADNIRSIPKLEDGLKVSTRKILYACFKKNLFEEKSEMKVSQLSGYISEHTEYHHGEVSLQGAIVNMAQDFIGSNNIPLLYPNGQFGTRLMGGKDSASSRYIFTYCKNNIKNIFIQDDNYVLDYNIEDGMKIEPKFYIPIIPMILVNGNEGIGTGWSSYIPKHNPNDIIDLLKLKLDDKNYREIKPWYRGFKGKIVKIKDNEYMSVGLYKVVGNNKIQVTELPIKKWTEDFKNSLDKLILNKSDIIKSYVDNSDDKNVLFTIDLYNNKLDYLRTKHYLEGHIDGIENYFKLYDSKNTKYTNMHLFNHENKIVKYKNIYQIIEDFYNIRIEYYQKRKNYLIKKLQDELLLLQNKVNYINSIINNKLNINNISIINLEKYLSDNKFNKLSINKSKKDYSYLIDLPIRSLTKEKVDLLNKQYKDKEGELTILQNIPIKKMYLKELNKIKIDDL